MAIAADRIQRQVGNMRRERTHWAAVAVTVAMLGVGVPMIDAHFWIGASSMVASLAIVLLAGLARRRQPPLPPSDLHVARVAGIDVAGAGNVVEGNVAEGYETGIRVQGPDNTVRRNRSTKGP